MVEIGLLSGGRRQNTNGLGFCRHGALLPSTNQGGGLPGMSAHGGEAGQIASSAAAADRSHCFSMARQIEATGCGVEHDCHDFLFYEARPIRPTVPAAAHRRASSGSS